MPTMSVPPVWPSTSTPVVRPSVIRRGRANSVSVIEAIAAFEDRLGRRLTVEYVEEPRVGDHVRYISDLRRLRAELEAMETRTDLTAKGARLRALRAAYLDALGSACRRLGVSPPAGGDPRHPGRVRLSEIYRVESALRERGLDVREGARR